MQNQTKLGLSLSNRSVLFDFATVETLIDAAKTAEDSGWFDGVWVGDNFLSKPRVDVMVTLSAIAAHTRAREVLLPLLFLPVALPIVIGAVTGSSAAMSGDGWEGVGRWLQFIVAFDAVFLVLCSWAFQFVLEE